MSRDFLDAPPRHDTECRVGVNGWRCAAGCAVAVGGVTAIAPSPFRAEHVASRALADGTGRHTRAELERATAANAARLAQPQPLPAAVAFTGIRCDALEAGRPCTAEIPGATDTPAERRRLTLRAEACGWQVYWVDGHSAHWCSAHRDVDRESVRGLK